MLQLKVPSTTHPMQLRRKAAPARLTVEACIAGGTTRQQMTARVGHPRTCESSKLLLGHLLRARALASRCRLAQQPGGSGEVPDAIQHSTQEPVCGALQE